MKIFQYLKIEVIAGVAWVSLNNPKKANALNRTLWFEIGEAFQLIGEDEKIKVCVLAGNGKHFSAGIDLNFLGEIMKECREKEEGQRRDFLYQFIRDMQAAFSALEACQKPVIAAIHGVCLGGGVDLISACDLRFGTKLSAFSIMETRLGIVADMGTLQRLRFIISDGRLREWALTSKIFRGFQAEKAGLLNKSYFTRKQMMKSVKKLAQTLSTLPDYTVQGTKEILNFGRNHNIPQGLEEVAKMNSELFLTEKSQKAFALLKKT